MNTLGGATEACLHAFGLVNERLKDQPESGVILDLQEELDRVRVWAGNLGALAKGHSALEWRLRDADLIRSTILTLLGLLRETLLRIVDTQSKSGAIVAISSNDASDAISLPSDDESDAPDSAATATDSLVLTVVELVNSLYRLSFKIRNSKTRPSRARFYKEIDLESGLELFDDFYADIDRDHVFELLGNLRASSKAIDNDETLLDRLHRTNCDYDFSTKITRTDVLVSDSKLIALRLATANTTRRRKFRYWSKHADKLAATEESPQAHQQFQIAHDGAQPGEGSKKIKPDQRSDLEKSIYTTTEATEVITGINVAGLETESVASIATTAQDLEGHVVSLPPPPKLASEGKDFVCPYCHVLCPPRHGSERLWRAHVIRDLEPYVCTYADCSSGDRLYDSRADWVDHENKKHRGVWKCALHSTLAFLTEASLKCHLGQDHAMTQDQVDALSRISGCTTEDERKECPICLETVRQIPNFVLHLANHMERIATFSLPRDLISDDGQSAKSNEAVPETGSDILTQISGSADDSESEAASEVWHRYSGRSHAVEGYQIGWICALPVEADLAELMLDKIHDAIPLPADDDNIYTFGQIDVDGEGRFHNVVIARPPGVGTGRAAAATVANDMRRTFTNLKFCLMVGIASGIWSPEVDVRLGDVVVGAPDDNGPGVVQYDHGKYMQGKDFVHRGILDKAPKVLRAAVSVAKQVRRRKAFLSHLDDEDVKELAPRPTDDILFEAAYTHPDGARSCAGCEVQRKQKRPERRDLVPLVHYATIASGNGVVKDALFADDVRRKHGILCFEMEAAGLYNFPCLVIRGISDYANTHKSDDWYAYAASTAAAYAKELLKVVPLTAISQLPSIG